VKPIVAAFPIAKMLFVGVAPATGIQPSAAKVLSKLPVVVPLIIVVCALALKEANSKNTNAALNEYNPKAFRVLKLIAAVVVAEVLPTCSAFNPNSIKTEETILFIF
jgi:hypothetical protein